MHTYIFVLLKIVDEYSESLVHKPQALSIIWLKIYNNANIIKTFLMKMRHNYLLMMRHNYLLMMRHKFQ